MADMQRLAKGVKCVTQSEKEIVRLRPREVEQICPNSLTHSLKEKDGEIWSGCWKGWFNEARASGEHV